jgi:hypothetical protein
MSYLTLLLILVGAIAVLAFLPVVLGWIIDPINAWRIRRFCVARGVEPLEVKPFPNHYGVHYLRGGVKVYAKCKPRGRGGIEWLSNEPDAS